MTQPQQASAVFGVAVRAARQRRGWSQEKLGNESGLSRPTIARIEHGDDVSTATLSKVASALELTVSFEVAGER